VKNKGCLQGGGDSKEYQRLRPDGQEVPKKYGILKRGEQDRGFLMGGKNPPRLVCKKYQKRLNHEKY